MKRILKVGIVGTAISMFFTGCGSSALTSGSGVVYEEIKWEIVETQENKEMLGESGLQEGETLPAMEVPDYYEQQSSEKLTDLEGVAAFAIAEGHSDDARDIETFKVGALRSDGTFVYCYTTRVGAYVDSEEEDTRPVVHCVMQYNYKTGDSKVLHEHAFLRSDSENAEDQESFYLQMSKSDGTGDFFVYDCGIGYLYDSTGEAKFVTSIEDFVREHFNGYSVVTTEALTSGGNRIYVDLVIEKSEIVSVDEQLDQNDNTSEDDADKEAEELDSEFDEKTIEVVLVYDFQTYESTMDQSNLVLDSQVWWWQLLGKYYSGDVGEEPSAEDDWNLVVSAIPNEWGPAFLWDMERWTQDQLKEFGVEDPYMRGTPVFQWTGEKKFGFRDEGKYVSNFIPEKENYQVFTDLNSNMVLSDLFVFRNGKYYELYGLTGNDLGEGDYYSFTFEREFPKKVENQIESIMTLTKDDGTTENVTELITEITTEYHSQWISVNRARDTKLQNSYLEGYWILDNCDSVFDVAEDNVFCLEGKTEDDVDYDIIQWLKDDGSKTNIAKVEADSMIDIFEDNGSLYMTVAYEGWTSIEKLDDTTKVCDTSFSRSLSSDVIKGAFSKVSMQETEVDSKYHDAYNEMSSEGGETLNDDGGEYLDGQNLRMVTVSNVQEDLLNQIETYYMEEYKKKNSNVTSAILKLKPEYKKIDRISQISGNGYLITSFVNGLVYYDISSGTAIKLEDGTWYGTWTMGDKYVSVGFSKQNDTYSTLDIAHARVKEYTLDTLYEDGLTAIVASTGDEPILKKKEESEGVKQLNKDFEEKRKDEEVIIINPDEKGWQGNTPGSVVEDEEKIRQEEKLAESKAREEAGEWDPTDELFYGTKEVSED